MRFKCEVRVFLSSAERPSWMPTVYTATSELCSWSVGVIKRSAPVTGGFDASKYTSAEGPQVIRIQTLKKQYSFKIFLLFQASGVNTPNANMAELSAGPGLQCSRAKARLVRPQDRVLFWRLHILAIESIDMVCFTLLRAWAPPKRRYYSSRSYLFTKKLGFTWCNSARRWDARNSENKGVLTSLALEKGTIEWM